MMILADKNVSQPTHAAFDIDVWQFEDAFGWANMPVDQTAALILFLQTHLG